MPAVLAVTMAIDALALAKKSGAGAPYLAGTGKNSQG